MYEKEQNFPVESVGHEVSYSQFSRGGCCDPLTACDYKLPIVVAYSVFDARGNGEGGVAPTITGDHENRVTDYTAVAVIESTNSNARICEPESSPAIIARAGTGGATPQSSSWKPVCVMATSHWNAPFTRGGQCPTICARAGTGGNQLPLIVLKRDEE